MAGYIDDMVAEGIADAMSRSARRTAARERILKHIVVMEFGEAAWERFPLDDPDAAAEVWEEMMSNKVSDIVWEVEAGEDM